MESPTAFQRYISQNSKKRTFPGGGSSSAACEEVDVLGMPPALDRSSKPKCSKQTEVICHEEIDVDMEENCDDDSLMDSVVDGSAKGKTVVTSSSVEAIDSAGEESGDDIAISSDGVAELEDSNEDDPSSNLFYEEDEWEEEDTYFKDMVFDDKDNLQTHFDNMELPPGVEASVPWFPSSPKKDTKLPTASTSTHSGRAVPKKLVDEIVHKFDTFAKFDIVEDYSDHHYSKVKCAAELAPKSWSKKIQEEWKILEKNLPAEIYVRAYESRMDLLRAVIIGAAGTPYHDGLFFFDVRFPKEYPNIPPEVHYHSGGLRINPNLYSCGKVCLSLLNTWSGSEVEKWNPGKSTILQVLVSIQGLILNAKPYFNEPGYERQAGTIAGEAQSSAYNENTFMHSLKTMLYSMQKPPKYFEDFVVGYFRKNARYILVSCVAYMNGARVGCLVSNDDKRSSKQFMSSVGAFITRLVNKFTEIGADGCQDFLSAAKKKSENGVATAAS